MFAGNLDTKNYIKWFLNKNTGVFEQLNKSEREVLESWKEKIVSCPAKLLEATEKYYFLEDVPKLIAEGEKMKSLIDSYVKAKRTLQNDQTAHFQKEKQEIDAAVKKLKAIPSVVSDLLLCCLPYNDVVRNKWTFKITLEEV